MNSNDYLRDVTGNRRFWPVRCTMARLDDLWRDRDQLWAEAVCRRRAGGIWWLDNARLVGDAQEQQAERLQHDPWHDMVDTFVSTLDDVSTAEILSGCLKKEKDRWERKDEMRIGAILRALGWERYKQRLPEGRNSFQWRYRRTNQ